jgi:hypothetical protein
VGAGAGVAAGVAAALGAGAGVAAGAGAELAGAGVTVVVDAALEPVLELEPGTEESATEILVSGLIPS